MPDPCKDRNALNGFYASKPREAERIIPAQPISLSSRADFAGSHETTCQTYHKHYLYIDTSWENITAFSGWSGGVFKNLRTEEGL
jgi:hypothetical protein